MSLASASCSLAAPSATLRADALARLPMDVWHADELAGAHGRTVASGHAALDAELPGGGWPLGALTELLQLAPGLPIWSLLLPAVVARQQADGGAVVLVNPPHEPFLPALAAGGLPPASLLWVRADTPAAQLWAAEQALRCADAAAVLAWLPRARSAELRRLHLAAAQRLDSLLFALRPGHAAADASPALLRLRMWLEMAAAADAPVLQVDLLKRRGPPLQAPVALPAHPARLRALLAASAPPRRGAAPRAGGHVFPFSARGTGDDQKAGHALDRLAVAA